MRRVFFYLVVIVAVSATANAYDWNTNPGDGTPENPYQISEPNHLMAIGSNAELLDKHFILTNDIIFDPNNNPAHVFDNALIALDTNNLSYSFSDTKFTGDFDGQNYGIYNFTCILPDGYYMGLFGYTETGSRIRNLHLYNIDIEGNLYVGGLVGMNYGSVENCSMEGTVCGTEDVGGLIGMNEEGGLIKDCHCDILLVNHGYFFAAGGVVGYNFEGDMVNCSSSGTIIGGDDSYMLGGVAGFNRGRIRQCYSSVDVSGLWYIGGLIGEHDWYELTYCYATGNVWGKEACGGLIGRNYCDVTYCYATGNVESTDYGCGGLIGENHWNMTIRQCYSVGVVTGVSEVGGLIGMGDENNQYIDCFWDINTSGQTESFGGQGMSTADLQNEHILISYGWDFAGETINGSSDDWGMSIGGGYPILWYQMDPLSPLPVFASGSGIPGDPYLLSDANDLGSIGHNPRLMDKHFRMISDIDCDGVFCPMIASENYPFIGVFDGNQHTISNLKYETIGERAVGLFSYLGEGGQIINLGINNLHIFTDSAGDGVGGLVGRKQGGELRGCSVNGSVKGYRGTGLLVGRNDGIINNCYTHGTVNGSSYVGGLIGINQGDVSFSYTAVTLDGMDYLGSIAGFSSGSYINCFWDEKLNLFKYSTNKQLIYSGLTGLPTALMQREDTFTSAGWDFEEETHNGNEDIWMLPPYGYPCFAWQAIGTIPDVNNLPLENAVNVLGIAGLKSFVKIRGYSNTIPQGAVIESIPAAGIQVSNAYPIKLVISAGPCPYEGGTGTKDNPCRLSSAAHLNTLSATPDDYGMHFVLSSNIDMTGQTYSDAVIAPDTFCHSGYSVYYTGVPFTGSFDGNGYVINGLSISSVSTVESIGLFGGISCNGMVSNLRYENVSITCPSGLNSGAIAGYTHLCQITNCQITGSIQGQNKTGGAIGSNYYSDISNISVNVSVSGQDNVGGILGYDKSGHISLCQTAGIVSGATKVGGLVANADSSQIENCHCQADIAGSDSVGGIAGYMTRGAVESCVYDSGSIDGTGSKNGGIIGEAANGVKITLCHSGGSITGANVTGGIIGRANAIVKSSYSTATITGTDSYVGGIVGSNGNSGAILQCNSTGAVRTTKNPSSYLGGIAGNNWGTIHKCYSTSQLSGIGVNPRYVGGLVGSHGGGSVSQSYANGSVSGYSQLGGLIGRKAGTATVSNCYAKTSVTGSSYSRYIGGLIGENTSSSQIFNCFSTGKVTGGSYIGGLIGSGSDGVVNSFWDTQTSTRSSSAGGIGKTTTEMKTKSTFTDYVWDFVGEDVNGSNDVWRMCVDGVDYPRLSWDFAEGGDFACADGVDLGDLEALAECWLLSEVITPAAFSTACDANGDGVIDLADFAVLSEHWP